MRAFLLDGLRQMVIAKFGEVAVAVIDEQARAWAARDQTPESRAEDLNTSGYVTVAKDFLGVDTTAELLTLFGEFWVHHVAASVGMTEKHDMLGETLRLAIQQINRVHTELLQSYPDSPFPLFKIDGPDVEPGVLPYRARCAYVDAELLPIAKGMIRQLCKMTLRGAEVANPVPCADRLDILLDNSKSGMGQSQSEPIPTYAFEIKMRRKSVVDAEINARSIFNISGRQVDLIFPFHIAFNYDMQIEQAGSHLLHMCPGIALGTRLDQYFVVVRPYTDKLDVQSVTSNLDSLFTLHKNTTNPMHRVVLNGQVVHFEEQRLFVFLGAPTLQSLRHTDGSLFDLPVFNRVCEIPFNFRLTEVELDTSVLAGQQQAKSQTAAPVNGPSALRLPSLSLLRSYASGVAVPQKDDMKTSSRITLYKWQPQDVPGSLSSNNAVEFTAPVQKILMALQKLRENVDADIQENIDTVLTELSSAYDVYLPSIEGQFDKKDTELSDYMASFFPRQSTMKFNSSRSSSLVPASGAMMGRRVSDGMLPAIASSHLGSFLKPLKQGFVYIGSPEDHNSWRQRYFLLEGNDIYYFRDQDPDSLPIGMIDLERYHTLRQMKFGELRVIELSSDPALSVRKYYFHAPEPRETKEWISVLVDKITEMRMNKQQVDWDNKIRSRSVSVSDNLPHPEVPTERLAPQEVTIDIPRRLSLKESHWTTKLGDLDFDVFKVAKVTNNRPLQFIGKALFQNLGLMEKYKIPENKLDNFLRCMERGYRQENRYHNAYHAADVTQTLYYFLITLRLAQYIGELDVFAAIVAAIIHDFMHPGLNNAYQINTRSTEAVLYNDQSVLENMHLSKAFQVLADEDCNVLVGLTDEEYKHFRAVVIHMVLNTDMSLHFELTGKFKSAITLLDREQLKKNSRLPNNTIMLILAMALHCADVSNPVKKHHIYIQWAERVMDEFWNQGDLERSNGLPISPMCDRNTVPIEKCQSSFINFIVEPLFEIFNDLVPEIADECIPNLRINKEMWLKMIEEKAVVAEGVPAPAATDGGDTSTGSANT